jgi:hypothetical protein
MSSGNLEGAMSLESQFDEAMLNIYVTAVREAKYTPSEFHRMLSERGGVATAKDLINRAKPSDGYTNLYLRGFLRLTVEAVIFDDPRWHPLFAPEELEICRKMTCTGKLSQNSLEISACVVRFVPG